MLILQFYRLIVDAHDHAMTLVNPATTYYEVVQTLRQLSLPYLHFRFQKVRDIFFIQVFSPSIKSQLLTLVAHYDFCRP